MEDFKLMKKNIVFAIKGSLFLFLLGIILFIINRTLVPKYFINTSWPTTSTYLGF